MQPSVRALEQIEFATERHSQDVTGAYEAILEGIGEDRHREGLKDTPKRAAKAISSLTCGYALDLREVVNGAVFTSDNREMVLVRNIEFYSLCEHHLLPFIGRCHVAYYPSGKVLGLSKLARIVDMFARRLQIQENLTKQIAEAIDKTLAPRGVAVQMTAAHLCMMMRGVEKQAAETTTAAMLGEFSTSQPARLEFLQQIPTLRA